MLRQIAVQTAQGKSIAVACRAADVSQQSDPRWRKAYGGLPVAQAKTRKDLERENAQLRRLVAGQFVDTASRNITPAGSSLGYRPPAPVSDADGPSGYP